VYSIAFNRLMNEFLLGSVCVLGAFGMGLGMGMGVYIGLIHFTD
jgi:hypothetical protein